MLHELKIVNPMNLLLSNDDIVKDLEEMKFWRRKAEQAKDGIINVTAEQKAQILTGIAVEQTCCSTDGQLQPKPFRLCSFMVFKVPIFAGIFLTKPTMFNTGFW